MNGKNKLLFFTVKRSSIVALQICTCFEEPPLVKMPGPLKYHQTRAISSRAVSRPQGSPARTKQYAESSGALADGSSASEQEMLQYIQSFGFDPSSFTFDFKNLYISHEKKNKASIIELYQALERGGKS